MLGRLASTSQQIFQQACTKPATVGRNQALMSTLVNNCRLGVTGTDTAGKSATANVSGTGIRFISCKRVKDRNGKKGSACGKKKGPAPAECPERSCRCKMPCELDTPTRVSMNNSKRDRPKTSKKDMRKKKCKEGDCDFMDEPEL